MNGLVDYLNEHTPLAPPLARLVLVGCLLALAWALATLLSLSVLLGARGLETIVGARSSRSSSASPPSAS